MASSQASTPLEYISELPELTVQLSSKMSVKDWITLYQRTMQR